MARIRFRLARERSPKTASRYTLLILPQSKHRFRKLHLSRRFVVFAAVTAGAR